MPGGFAFNFSGDDIDVEADGEADLDADADAGAEMAMDVDNGVPAASGTSGAAALPRQNLQSETTALVKEESIAELLESLPSRLSYSTVKIAYLGVAEGGSNAVMFARTPRRELFDVRMQLMSEDNSPPSSSTSTTTTTTGASSIAGLSDADIERNIYEGGFKTWESAIDISSHLCSQQQQQQQCWLAPSVVELGCGTALPSLQLFRAALRRQTPLELVLCDYNSSVLRLVTLPNLLLVWAATRSEDDRDAEQQWEGDGVLDITPELLSSFLADLEQRSIKIRLISGPWSPELVSAITSLRERPETGHVVAGRLVLAAETIYSPHTLQQFTDVFVSLLRAAPSHTLSSRHAPAHSANRGLIGAKRVYFGVGGGVNEFTSLLHAKAGSSSSSSSSFSQLSNHNGEASSSSLTNGGAVQVQVQQHTPITLSRDPSLFSVVEEEATEVDDASRARSGGRGVERCLLEISLSPS